MLHVIDTKKDDTIITNPAHRRPNRHGNNKEVDMNNDFTLNVTPVMAKAHVWEINDLLLSIVPI